VVVGVDGSRNAVTAALWAVDEALQRDVPLRLVRTIEPRDDALHQGDAARALATAEIAVREAFIAVESTERPVKIEVEILHGSPTDMLRQASRAASMLCIGAVGLSRTTSAGPMGSTASALAAWANCPVAIIRGYFSSQTASRTVLVEVDQPPEGDTVLQRGIDEALLRNAPLEVVCTWQHRVTDVHDVEAVAEQSRRVTGELNRRLERATRRYPELEVRPVATHGSLLDYLSQHAHSIQLVVIGRRRARGVAEVVGPAGCAALRDTACSVLVCPSNRPL
jgi:nucleotide-binding universal stress UspA family protein